MDLKALIAKMDVIEKKQVLNEDAKVTKTSSGGTVTKTEKGSIHKAGPKGYGNKWDGETQDQAPAKPSKGALTADQKKKRPDNVGPKKWKHGTVTTHSSNKGAEKDDGTGDLEESFNFKGSIARALLREFDLDEAVANPWEGKDPAKAAAWAALSPEDQKWLGGADPTDKYILMRAPNKGAKAAAAAPAASLQDIKPGLTAPLGRDGKPMKEVPPDAAPAANKPTVADQGTNGLEKPAAGVNPAVAAMASGQGAAKGPGQLPQPGQMPDDVRADMEKTMSAPVAPGAVKWPTTPDEIAAFQKANGLVPDKLIGAKTMAALQKAGATPPAGFKPVANKAAPGQSARATTPQASQSQVRAVDNKIASDQNSAKIAQIDTQLAKYAKYPQSYAQIIARLNKEKAALTGAAPAEPVKTTPGQDMAARAAAAGAAEFGVQESDNSILNLIRSAFKR